MDIFIHDLGKKSHFSLPYTSKSLSGEKTRISKAYIDRIIFYFRCDWRCASSESLSLKYDR